jgi:hypothetical protein
MSRKSVCAWQNARPWPHVALTAVGLAVRALHRYSTLTDDPAPGVVEAADYLDEAVQHLSVAARARGDR